MTLTAFSESPFILNSGNDFQMLLEGSDFKKHSFFNQVFSKNISSHHEEMILLFTAKTEQTALIISQMDFLPLILTPIILKLKSYEY